MSLATISFHRPATLLDACALAVRLGPDAAFLAGGTELLPDFQRGRETARDLIALDRIDELRGIHVDRHALRIGALTTVAEIATSRAVHTWVPALSQAASVLGSPPIRSLATIGGNFCRAVPCADLPPVAIVSGARLRLLGVGGERQVAAEDFFVGPRQTVLEHGEVLVEVIVPAQPAASGASYQRFARRRGSALAVASVAARVVLAGEHIDEVRIALGAVAPTPLLVHRGAAALRGEAPSAELFELAAALCAEEALPITDIRGSDGFRRELVHVLARRALVDAIARARGA